MKLFMLSRISYRACRYGLLLVSLSFQVIAVNTEDQLPIEQFITLVKGSAENQKQATIFIENHWQDNYTTIVLETMTLVRNPSTRDRLLSLLQSKTKQNFGYDTNQWFQWLWLQKYQPHPQYGEFKSALYGLIDTKFRDYFSRRHKSNIRLDEVRWGGVVQDGIPPLREPKMISAEQAAYLEDSNIVFGIEVNGDIRAYPKRILAWHEMFVDKVGGVPLIGVYCTLCGTVIIYDTVVEGVHHQMGTSGFLYRSNKLMYDKATQSLWSTFSGSPVIGSLVNKDILLPHRYVVTTTWGEWKRRHPSTQVLSIDTGYQRDYGEGVAYRQYFATDELMFNVPKLDKRLKNKAEVLGLIFSKHPDKPLAIAVKYLAEHPIYHGQIGDQSFVALTDKSGAIRVYDNNNLTFMQWDQDNTAIDENGLSWTLAESQLTSSNGKVLSRLPANRAFWFGWFSSYSHTQLVY